MSRGERIIGAAIWGVLLVAFGILAIIVSPVAIVLLFIDALIPRY